MECVQLPLLVLLVLQDSSALVPPLSLAQSVTIAHLVLQQLPLAVYIRAQLDTTSLTLTSHSVLDAQLDLNVKLLSLKPYLALQVFTALRELLTLL